MGWRGRRSGREILLNSDSVRNSFLLVTKDSESASCILVSPGTWSTLHNRELAVLSTLLTLILGPLMRLSFIFLTFKIGSVVFNICINLQTWEMKCGHNYVYSHWRMKFGAFPTLLSHVGDKHTFISLKCPPSPLFCPDYTAWSWTACENDCDLLPVFWVLVLLCNTWNFLLWLWNCSALVMPQSTTFRQRIRFALKSLCFDIHSCIVKELHYLVLSFC